MKAVIIIGRGRPRKNPEESLQKVKPKEKKTVYFKCATCGKEYKESLVPRSFPYSYSPIYAGNSNRLTTCTSCVKDIFKQYCEILGDELAAFRRICMKFDIYYNEELIATAKKTMSARSLDFILGPYMSAQTMGCHSGKTYDSTIREESAKKIEVPEEIDELKAASEDKELLKKASEIFGPGYATDEYALMIFHYNKLKEAAEEDDYVQDALIMDLCDIKIQQKRLKESTKFDYKEYESLTKLYQSTLASANLKPKAKKEEVKSQQEDAYGQFIELIENYCPADYIEDHKIFEDADGMADYYKRHILRSTTNLVTGSNERDPEFTVGADEDEQ